MKKHYWNCSYISQEKTEAEKLRDIAEKVNAEKVEYDTIKKALEEKARKGKFSLKLETLKESTMDRLLDEGFKVYRVLSERVDYEITF